MTPKALVVHFSEAVKPLTLILETQCARVESRRVLGPIERAACAFDHRSHGEDSVGRATQVPAFDKPSYEVPEQKPQEVIDPALARSSPGTFQQIRG